MSDTKEITLPAGMETDEAVEVLEEAGEYNDPEIVEADNYEALQDKVSQVRGVLEEALIDRTELKEETVSALAFEALTAEFEDEEGELQVEALSQEPETSEPEPEESPEALGENADKEKAEALYNDYQTFGTEGLKADIVEALGVEDFDTAIEVLD